MHLTPREQEKLLVFTAGRSGAPAPRSRPQAELS